MHWLGVDMLSKRLWAKHPDLPFPLVRAAVEVISNEKRKALLAVGRKRLEQWPMKKESRFDNAVFWLRGFGRLDAQVGYGALALPGEVISKTSPKIGSIFVQFNFKPDAVLFRKVNPTIELMRKHKRHEASNLKYKNGILKRKKKPKSTKDWSKPIAMFEAELARLTSNLLAGKVAAADKKRVKQRIKNVKQKIKAKRSKL